MELLIPFGTEYIEDGEFSECEAERVILPESLKEIGSEAFSGCARLREISLPPMLRELSPAVFLDCEVLERVEMPEGLLEIGEGAFVNCGALREISFPSSLRRIDAMAFWGCGLESVTVPASVESVEENAFWECESLREANVLGRATAVGDNAFGSCYNLTRGYIAPGYCGKTDAPAELLYTLLWCTCPSRHDAATGERARAFIGANEQLVMERVFKYNNTAALTGIAELALLRPENINGYVRQAADAGLTELTALLLKARGAARDLDGEFKL